MSIFATRGAPVSATALVLCVGVAGPATAAQNADTPSTASNPIAVDDSQIHTAPLEEPEEDLIEMPGEGSNTPRGTDQSCSTPQGRFTKRRVLRPRSRRLHTVQSGK